MKNLLPLLCIALLAYCTPQKTDKLWSEQAITISDVSIVDVTDGSIKQNQHLLIDSGRIVRIGNAPFEIAVPENKIDGSGKYLLPGLAEMHAHIPPQGAGQQHIENMLFLYLSNGVTTIRGMLGHPYHLELKKQAASNQLLSPRIYTSSPSLNGNSVKTKEEARQKITQYQKDGYDFLKIHPGIKRDVFEEVVNTADETGIRFAGHVPVDVGIHMALRSKYTSIDHVDGYLEGLVPDQADVSPSSNGFFGYNFTPLADTSRIDELLQLTSANNVWVVPTQSLFERWFSPTPAEEYAQNPEMKYMPASTIEQWIKSKNNLTQNENYNAEQWAEFITLRRELIYRLQHNSPGLLLGSDAPQVFNVPGFSIHHELQCMLEAGLTPLEALQSGTIHPARFFDQEGEYGIIATNASADLILLDNNPLDDLENLKNPAGVMVRGVWLSKKSIADKLAAIARQSAEN